MRLRKKTTMSRMSGKSATLREKALVSVWFWSHSH